MTLFVLRDANVFSKLYSELCEHMPNPDDLPSVSELEQLPYLISHPLCLVINLP